MSKGLNSHQALRDSLHGQRVSIPNLYALFPEWQCQIHKEYAKARDEVLNPWLQHWVENPDTRRKLQMADFGIFAAVLCADSTFTKLCTVAKYFAWFFIWDDIFDCGSLTHDEKGLMVYRETTVTYFKYALGGQGECPDLSGLNTELENALLCWDEVGSHIRQTCSQECCEILLENMLSYVESVDSIDTIYDNGRTPSIEQYWQRRELTAGVYPVIPAIPFIYSVDVMKQDLEDRHMSLLWRHTSHLVHITNDMFSMRKEVRDNQIENLIPMLMLNNGLGCNESMQLSFHLAQQEANEFRKVENHFHHMTGNRSAGLSDIFIEGCKNVVMGLVNWSYSGQRYFRTAEIGKDYEIQFQL